MRISIKEDGMDEKDLSNILSEAKALVGGPSEDPESIVGRMQEAIVNAELLIPDWPEVLKRLSIARDCLERLPSSSTNNGLKTLIENVPRTAT